VYYRTSDAVDAGDHRLPFVFELAAAPLSPDANIQTIHKFGINYSVAHSSPRMTVEFTDRDQTDRSHRQISSAFDDEDHDFVVVSNLICPNIPFKNKRRQSFPTEPFNDAVSGAVGKAIRKYQRGLRPMLNSLEEDDNDDTPTLPEEKKSPQGFVKEAVFDLFESVYLEATNGGEYTIIMRQFLYKLRPASHSLAER
jgi:hypothetical protein